MFFGLGFLELLLALSVIAVPIAALAWILSRFRRSASPPNKLSDSGVAAVRAELDATQERLMELEAKLERTDERLEFTEQLRSGPER